MSFDIAKIEMGAWLEPPTVFEAAKVEIGAWLEPGTITPDPGGWTPKIIIAT